MEIKHLKYKEIDFIKYDNCIENAVNSRVYAYSWYLDIVANKDWEILILGDYQVVMPLPFKRVKRKFFKRMITQPLFCQQLGVFYFSKISNEAFQLFLNKFLTFTRFTYNFNSDNNTFLNENKKFSERINYELNLSNSYNELKNNFSKNLKRNIKKALKNELEITKNITVTDFIQLKKDASTYEIKPKQYKLMNNLMKTLILKKKGVIYVAHKKGVIFACLFIVKNKNKFINFTSANTISGKKTGAISLIFNKIIKENSNTTSYIDFEGSMINSIAKFFKNFNATTNNYFSHIYKK